MVRYGRETNISNTIVVTVNMGRIDNTNRKTKIHDQKQENNQKDFVDKRRNRVFQTRKRLATQIIIMIIF